MQKDSTTSSPERFTSDQVIAAIEDFLEYGESSFVETKVTPDSLGHCGYLSKGGWAACCLRFHLTELKQS